MDKDAIRRLRDIDILVQDIVRAVKRSPADAAELAELLDVEPEEIEEAVKLDRGYRIKFRGKDVIPVRR